MVMMRDLIIIIIISMMYLVVEPVFNRLHKLHVARSRPSLTVTSLSLSARHSALPWSCVGASSTAALRL